MSSMPLLIAEDGSPLVDIDQTDFENIPVLHLSSQDSINDFDINDFVNFADVPEPNEQIIIENPIVSQLSSLKHSSSTLPLGVDKKSRTIKRKVTKASSSIVTDFKEKKESKSVVRQKKPATKSDRSKRKPKGTPKEMKSDLKAEPLSSFSPLHRFGEMKRKAKCRLVKAQMTIAELEKSERAINANNETLEALDAKIALAKVELARMSKDADELRSKIGKDKQFHQRSRMQAQAELEESTKLYETALSVRDNWQKELDTAFQSDGD